MKLVGNEKGYVHLSIQNSMTATISLANLAIGVLTGTEEVPGNILEHINQESVSNLDSAGMVWLLKWVTALPTSNDTEHILQRYFSKYLEQAGDPHLLAHMLLYADTVHENPSLQTVIERRIEHNNLQHNQLIQSARRSIELDRRFEHLCDSRSPPDDNEGYVEDLKWYSNNEDPLFIGPSYHRLILSAICQALSKKIVSDEHINALEKISSTGVENALCVAQLHYCNHNQTRCFEIIQHVIDTVHELPNNDSSQKYAEDFRKEWMLAHNHHSSTQWHPRNLPWMKSRPIGYWRLVLDLEVVNNE